VDEYVDVKLVSKVIRRRLEGYNYRVLMSHPELLKETKRFSSSEIADKNNASSLLISEPYTEPTLVILNRQLSKSSCECPMQ
jgi:hypothetical protein